MNPACLLDVRRLSISKSDRNGGICASRQRAKIRKKFLLSIAEVTVRRDLLRLRLAGCFTLADVIAPGYFAFLPNDVPSDNGVCSYSISEFIHAVEQLHTPTHKLLLTRGVHAEARSLLPFRSCADTPKNVGRNHPVAFAFSCPVKPSGKQK